MWVIGATPALEAQSRYPMIVTVICVVTGIMCITVGIRAWVRAHIVKNVGVDDWILFASAVRILNWEAWYLLGALTETAGDGCHLCRSGSATDTIGPWVNSQTPTSTGPDGIHSDQLCRPTNLQCLHCRFQDRIVLYISADHKQLIARQISTRDMGCYGIYGPSSPDHDSSDFVFLQTHFQVLVTTDSWEMSSNESSVLRNGSFHHFLRCRRLHHASSLGLATTDGASEEIWIDICVCAWALHHRLLDHEAFAGACSGKGWRSNHVDSLGSN